MRYHNITKDDMLNGDGLRVVLWVSGCQHNCPGCQNPITHDPNDGVLFTYKDYLEIKEQLDKNYISGLTLSGGDPLFESNREVILNICRRVKKEYPTKTIWLYTGFTWEELMQVKSIRSILKCIDVLVDGRFIESLKDNNLMWKGSSNQRVIDVKSTLQAGSVILHCPNYEKEMRNNHDEHGESQEGLVNYSRECGCCDS